MNDREKLEWVANHMASFHPGFSTAHMEWVDDDGNTHYVDYVDNSPDRDRQVTNLELLEGCIDKATTK